MLILLFILKYKRPEEQPFTAPFRSFYIHLPYLHYFLNFSSILSIIVASYLFFLSYKQTPRRNRNHRNQRREHYRFRCKRCIAVIARRKDRCSCTGWHSRHDDCHTCCHRIQSGRRLIPYARSGRRNRRSTLNLRAVGLIISRSFTSVRIVPIINIVSAELQFPM